MSDEKKDFFAGLPDEKKDEEKPIEEEPKAEEPPAEEPKPKSAMEISLERKSTALAEERRKRRALEAQLAEMKKPEPKKTDEEPKDDAVPEVKPLDEEALLAKLDERRRKEDYSGKVIDKISFIARGAGKSRQWAEKIKETVDNLPANLKSGDPETDTQTAIRYIESAGGASGSLPGGSIVDLPSAAKEDENLSASGRELAKQRLNIDDKEVDRYLATPRTKLDNGNVSFKLIK